MVVAVNEDGVAVERHGDSRIDIDGPGPGDPETGTSRVDLHGSEGIVARGRCYQVLHLGIERIRHVDSQSRPKLAGTDGDRADVELSFGGDAISLPLVVGPGNPIMAGVIGCRPVQGSNLPAVAREVVLEIWESKLGSGLGVIPQIRIGQE